MRILETIKQPFRSSEVVSDKKENLFYYTETDDTGNFFAAARCSWIWIVFCVSETSYTSSKGSFLYAGSMKNLTEEAQGKIWVCKVPDEEKAREWNVNIVLHQNNMLREDYN